MSLVSMIPLLEKATRGNYAVGLFVVHDSLIVQAVLDAAVKKHSPVILAFPEVFMPLFDMEALVALMKESAQRLPIPVALQFDHGETFEGIVRAIRCGFTDVMMDASALPYEENVRRTKEAVRLAHAVGVGVEGELGIVGTAADYGDVKRRVARYTKQEEVGPFVAETGVDALAIAFGTTHGIPDEEQILDFERLKRIREVTDLPLVAHGGDGTTSESWRKAIALGLTKINIGITLAQAGQARLREALASGTPYRESLVAQREAIQAVVADYLEVFGSAGRADD
jgi:fructose-bisphosphate aldolase class II